MEVASLASAFAYSSFHDDLPGRSRDVRYNPDLWLLRQFRSSLTQEQQQLLKRPTGCDRQMLCIQTKDPVLVFFRLGGKSQTPSPNGCYSLFHCAGNDLERR